MANFNPKLLCPDADLPDTPFISIKQAAGFLGVGPKFILERIHRGCGPPFSRVGMHYRLPKSSFIEWASQSVIP